MNYYTISLYTILAVICYSIFGHLYCAMRKYHYYEFRKMKRSHCLYIFCGIFYFLLLMAYNILIELYMEHENISANERNTYFIVCSLSHKGYFMYFVTLKAIISVLHLPEMFFCFVIFYIKPTVDVL